MRTRVERLRDTARESIVRRARPAAFRRAAAAVLALVLAGCGTVAKRDAPSKAPPAPRPGGYYLDDGPGANPPADLDSIPEPVPRIEPLHRGAMRPYVAMGKSYTPMTSLQPYRARGIASWYGRRYHGRPTASGEPYDMYALTAAHPELPIPSYARVTHLGNGRSVVVRINDRGPFVGGRLIDLSYTAAYRIGLLGTGTALVEVESILPEDGPAVLAAARAASAPEEPVAAGSSPESPTRTTARNAPQEKPPASPSSPAQEAVAASTAAALPLAVGAGGYFLQLGAFASRENAEAFLERLKAQLDWLAHALHIRAGEGLFRVHAGPYSSEALARGAAERVAEALGLRPFVLSR